MSIENFYLKLLLYCYDSVSWGRFAATPPHMTNQSVSPHRCLLVTGMLFSATLLCAQTASKPNEVTVDWNNTVIVSKSTPTLQVVVNPMLRSGSPIHDDAYKAVKQLGADYVRYVPWLPYPRLGLWRSSNHRPRKKPPGTFPSSTP